MSAIIERSTYLNAQTTARATRCFIWSALWGNSRPRAATLSENISLEHEVAAHDQLDIAAAESTFDQLDVLHNFLDDSGKLLLVLCLGIRVVDHLFHLVLELRVFVRKHFRLPGLEKLLLRVVEDFLSAPEYLGDLGLGVANRFV